MRSTSGIVGTFAVIAVLVAMTACSGLDFGFGSQDQLGLAGGRGAPSGDRAGINNGPLPAECAKTEGGNLGVEGVTLSVNGVTVTLSGWISKDGEPGEYIGFSFTPVDEFVSVKAGGEIYQQAGGGSWIHPAGTGGPEASAISNIVFCPPGGDDDGSGDPGEPGGPGTPGDGDLFCSETHPELCPGGIYTGDGSSSGTGSGDGSASGSDDGSGDGTSSDTGSGGDVCSETHPELCPGGVYTGDGSSSGDSSDGDDGSGDGTSSDTGSGGDVCSETHPELCPGGVYTGDGSSDGVCSEQHPEYC